MRKQTVAEGFKVSRGPHSQVRSTTAECMTGEEGTLTTLTTAITIKPPKLLKILHIKLIEISNRPSLHEMLSEAMELATVEKKCKKKCCIGNTSRLWPSMHIEKDEMRWK